MISVLMLSYYNVKRIARHRALLLILLGIPLVLALLRAIFAGSELIMKLTWACPVICLILVAGAIFFQFLIDEATGLNAAIKSSPSSDATLLASRFLSGMAFFAVQMGIFSTILILRY